MEVEIDLSGCINKKSVLLKIGEVLEFGGPDGNVLVTVGDESKGWGMNWDALFDSLGKLENGGIHGKSKIFHFPLRINFLNSEGFTKHQPDQFHILEEILADTKEYYAKYDKSFSFAFL
jgi:hypothetical protein